MTIRQLLHNPETRLLLAHITGQSKTWLLAHPETRLTSAQEQALQQLQTRLQAGEPLPYLLGHWEFYGLSFDISPDALIPRPETELLIELCLRWQQEHAPQKTELHFLDVGTGSGILPVTLATLLPRAEFWATDISPAALTLARRNAQKHGVEDRIHFTQADLLPKTVPPTAPDILTANLPYIPTATLRQLPIFGREPTLALDGGPDGLSLIRQLLARLAEQKIQWQLLLLEIECRQGAAVSALLREHFPAAKISIHKDLAGLERVAQALAQA